MEGDDIMKKNMRNKMIVAVMFMALAVTGCGSTETSSSIATEAVVTVESELVATNAQGNLVDGITGKELTTEEVEQLKKEGVIEVDENGNTEINTEKNHQTMTVTVDEKGEVKSVKDESGKDVTAAAKDNKTVQTVAETVREETERKAEEQKTEAKQTEAATTRVTEAPTECQTAQATETSTTKITERQTEQVTERQTEKPTERVTEKVTESATTKVTESATERATERQTERATERQTEKPTERTTEAPTERQTERQTEAPTERQTEKPTEKPTERTTEAATECSHNWVWKTHTTTVHHDAVYKDVPIYSEEWDEEIYAKKILCSVCYQFFDTEADYRAKSHTCAGGASSLVSVVVGYKHHDPELLDMDQVLEKAAWDEVVEVKDYQYCSKCGTKK